MRHKQAKHGMTILGQYITPKLSTQPGGAFDPPQYALCNYLYSACTV